jgi:hypothetical protein
LLLQKPSYFWMSTRNSLFWSPISHPVGSQRLEGWSQRSHLGSREHHVADFPSAMSNRTFLICS